MQEAFIATEYASSYSFKADAIHINTRFIATVKILQDQTKTPQQIARSVLIKVGSITRVTLASLVGAFYSYYISLTNGYFFVQALNLCNGGVTLGAIMVATVLLGYGESHVSYKTKAHDMRAYAAAIFAEDIEAPTVNHVR